MEVLEYEIANLGDSLDAYGFDFEFDDRELPDFDAEDDTPTDYFDVLFVCHTEAEKAWLLEFLGIDGAKSVYTFGEVFNEA